MIAGDHIPLETGSVDAVAVLGRAAVEGISAAPGLQSELRRVLVPRGSVYSQWTASGRRAKPDAEWMSRFGAVQALWLLTRDGELRAAAPAGDEAAITRLREDAAQRRSTVASRLVYRLRGRPRARWREAVGALAGDQPGAPPSYIAEIAAEWGIDVRHHRWALVDHGGYRTKKVIFYLSAAGRGEPQFVVKMTREPIFNDRLENARRALEQLDRAGLGSGGEVPRLAFFGHHGGLAVLGETAVRGRPLGQRQAAPTTPEAAKVLGWLVQVAARTADRTAHGPAVASGFSRFVARFDELYRPGPRMRGFIDRQIAAIASYGGSVPLVLQHGDAGPWNVLLAENGGQPGFIDWEAAITDGAPLWDVFHFFRASVLAGLRSTRQPHVLRALDASFFQPSPASNVLAATVAAYCTATGLASQLVVPLFHLCWMHRAIKEASRSPRGKTPAGPSLSVLELCMRRDGEGSAPSFLPATPTATSPKAARGAR